jgi:hypothetical protein
MLPIANNPYGQFVSYTLTPPLDLLPGDVVNQLGNTVTVTRNGVVVETRALENPTVLPTQSVSQSQTVSTLLLFEGHAMAVSIRCESVSYENGGVQVVWSDSTSQEGATVADLVAEVAAENKATIAKKLALAAWLERSATLTDPTWLIGKTIELDPGSDLAPLRIGDV